MNLSTTQLPATDLFQAAYQNRYTWDANFPGVRAKVTLKHNDLIATADVEISAKLKVTVTNANSPEAEKAIFGQMQEIVIHRVQRSFAEVHGKNEFSYGETDDQDDQSEALILVGGAAAGDRYKVKNNIVSMVHRHIHGTVVTINVLTTFDTGKGYLPMDYDSFYTKPNQPDQPTPVQHHHDDYAQFGEYTLLTGRTVTSDDGEVMELQLSDIALAAPEV